MKAIEINRQDFGVTIRAEAIDERDTLLTETQTLEAVEDELDESTATDYLKRLQTLLKNAEASRKSVKKPVTDLGKRIDDQAKYFTNPAAAERDRIQKLLNGHYRKERERIERERREAEEAKRKAEIERLRAENAKREAQKANEDDPFAATKAANEAAQNQVNQAEVERQEQEAKQAELAATAKAAQTPHKQKQDGMIVRQPWRYKVVDIDKLYAERPDLCKLEEKPSAIQAALRQGDRNIPGLEIWQDVDVGVRT